MVRGAGIEPARGFPHRIFSIYEGVSSVVREVLESYI